MVEKTANLVSSPVTKLLADIAEGVQALEAEIAAVEGQLADLEAQGMLDAGTWYKDEKYLYLVYPTGDPDVAAGRKKRREYVGKAGSPKAQAALAKIERLTRGVRPQLVNKLSKKHDWILR